MYYEPDLRKTEVLPFGPRQYDPNDETRNSLLTDDYMRAVSMQIDAVEGNETIEEAETVGEPGAAEEPIAVPE
jgi:hypothetical protein